MAYKFNLSLRRAQKAGQLEQMQVLYRDPVTWAKSPLLMMRPYKVWIISQRTKIKRKMRLRVTDLNQPDIPHQVPIKYSATA